MSVLAMDTSTAHCTVAFGDRCAGVVAPTGHAEHLAALIRDVVPDMGAVERIVVGVGPGPYTGLRVGVVTGATMAQALGNRWAALGKTNMPGWAEYNWAGHPYTAAELAAALNGLAAPIVEADATAITNLGTGRAVDKIVKASL